VWWFGWYYSGDVFEGYVLKGSLGVSAELQAAGLPKADAAAIVRSFALAP